MTRGSLAILLLVTACGGKIEPDAGGHSPTHVGGGKPAGVSPETPPQSQVDYAATTACKGQPNPPNHLECTGLYADFKQKTLAAGVREYAPAVVLWSDGAEKHRYIQLPKGEKIDASNPNEWIFPI